jgi:hypothetical protein
VPVISVARAMALTGVVKSFNPHKAARWCHSDPRWMPCECRECWMLTFIICFSVRVGFFVCHVPGETHKLMVSNGTCLDAAGMGFHWEQWARCFPLQGRSERNLRGQRYECAIHHEIVPQTWNVLERMLNCCFMLFYVVFLLFWVFPDTVSLQFLSALQCILLGWRSFFLPLGVLKPKDWERNSSRERGCHYLPGWSKLLWGNQILQFNEGASWLQLRAALRLKYFDPAWIFRSARQLGRTCLKVMRRRQRKREKVRETDQHSE